VSFATITLCVASQLVFTVVVYFVIDSVRKLLDTPSYSNAVWLALQQMKTERKCGLQNRKEAFNSYLLSNMV
jgi:hypothetical protein